MSAGSLASAFIFGLDILKTVVDASTRTVLVQLGNVLSEKSDSDNAEWWQHVGFVSRASKPAAKKAAAQVVGFRTGDRDVVIASRDLRGQALAGNLKDGESCLYAAGDDGNAQARVLLKANGDIAIFTRDGNTEGAAGVILQIGSDSTLSFVSKHGGMRLDATGWTFSAGKSALILGSSGNVKLQANGLCEVAGKITCIGTNCLPLPTNTAIHGPTGMSGAPSTSVYIGT